MENKNQIEELLLKFQLEQFENNKMYKKIKIKNLSALSISFVPETIKDEESRKGLIFNPYMISERLDYSEIKSQIRSENIYFTGKDGLGSHAPIRICDFEMYKDLFDVPDATDYPIQLTEENIKMLIAEKNRQKFQKKLEEYVVTKSEAATMIDFLETNNLFDEIVGWKKDSIIKRYKNILFGI